jgi:hypothetical protein
VLYAALQRSGCGGLFILLGCLRTTFLGRRWWLVGRFLRRWLACVFGRREFFREFLSCRLVRRFLQWWFKPLCQHPFVGPQRRFCERS